MKETKKEQLKIKMDKLLKRLIGNYLLSDFYFESVIIKKGTKILNIEVTKDGYFDIKFDIERMDITVYDCNLFFNGKELYSHENNKRIIYAEV